MSSVHAAGCFGEENGLKDPGYETLWGTFSVGKIEKKFSEKNHRKVFSESHLNGTRTPETLTSW